MSLDLVQRTDGDTDAPPVLLVNSLGAELGMWEEQLPALGDRMQVLRYNQRGHGGSPAPSGPYSIEELASDALELLDGNGIERASLVGCSLGGMVGAWIAINAPQRVEKLVLCSTSAHVPPPSRWLERAEAVREGGMGAVTDATLERWFSDEFRAAGGARLEALRDGLLGTDPGAYALCCEGIAELDLREGLSAIAASTLVITAADDLSIPPEHGERLAEAIPGAELLAIERGRHLLNVELPEHVNEPLVAHLLGEPASA
jgi:3-oxoadipate enol-lactonase